jgi:hypothetical protein
MNKSGARSIDGLLTMVRVNNYFQPHYQVSFIPIVYETNYIWTDALRDEGSADWYWETSKNMLTENDFYWGSGQPSLPNATVQSCINFSYYSGGYDDDECTAFPFLDAMCQ